MNNKFENLNPSEDAELKFSKLCEIVQDIEVNGHGGDQFPRQVVLNAVVNSQNQLLWDKLEKSLFEEDKSELMKTVLVGLLMQKGNISPLCKYTDNILKNVSVLDESFEGKESLLLLADSLIKGVLSDDKLLKKNSLNSLFKLYKVSCHPESKIMIADQLLQRLINILPNQSKAIDSELLKLIKDVEAEINTRIISIDILSRSKPKEFFTDIESIINNLQEYSKNSIEKMYLLDVSTKFVYNLAISNLGMCFSSLSKVLCKFNLENIANDAKAEYGSEGSEHFDVMSKRIAKRIAHLNEMVNSLN